MQREFRKLAASFKAALAGLSRTARTERNFRIHICSMLYVLFFAWLGNINKHYYPALFLCFGLVIVTEIINSVIELICNVISNRFDMILKAIKDMAAGAVLVGAICAAAVGMYVFARPEIINNVVLSLFQNLHISLVLIISIPVAVIFILGKKS